MKKDDKIWSSNDFVAELYFNSAGAIAFSGIIISMALLFFTIFKV